MWSVRHILVVEDDPAHAKLILRQLASRPQELAAERVESGEAALQYLRCVPPYEDRRRPDLILLDLHMPGLSGLEVLRQLKLDPDLRYIPVVVLTTSDQPCDTMEAYCLGANSYLVKPLDYPQLRRMLDEVTEYWCAWNQTA